MLEVHAAVRSDACNLDIILADALAGGLVGEPLRGFENEHGGRFERQLLRDGAGDGAADLFVAVQEQSDGARQLQLVQEC